MRKVKRWTGLSCIMAFLLVFSILGTSCAMSYDSVVNGALGIQVSKIVEGEAPEGEEADTTYYKSAYGELSEDNLELVKEASYAQAVQE